jgi:hypothetical protein
MEMNLSHLDRSVGNFRVNIFRQLGLQNAASIASLILTTDCAIVEVPKGRSESGEALAE